MTSATIGIDPGAHGAICLLDPDYSDEILELHGATPQEIYRFLLDASGSGPPVVCIEKVHYRPGGARGSSLAKLCTSYGMLCGMAAALAHHRAAPYTEVTPSRWMTALGIPKGGTSTQRNQAIRAMAQSLYPHLRATNDTAAAILLAHYARTTGALQ